MACVSSVLDLDLNLPNDNVSWVQDVIPLCLEKIDNNTDLTTLKLALGQGCEE